MKKHILVIITFFLSATILFNMTAFAKYEKDDASVKGSAKTMPPVLTIEKQTLNFVTMQHDDLERLVWQFTVRMVTSSQPFRYNDFSAEIKAFRKVSDRDGIHYYCKYKNDRDLVFVFFYGDSYDPEFILDVNNTFSETICTPNYQSFYREQYAAYYQRISPVDI